MQNTRARIAIGLLLPLLLANCGSATTGALTGAALTGAASTAKLMQQNTPRGSQIQGGIKKNVYTSPNGRFRFQMPETSPPREIHDGFPPPAKGAWVVAFNYANCRAFSVSEKRGELERISLGEWVNKNIIAEAKKIGVSIKERKIFQTRYGPAVFIRTLIPQGGTCQIIQYHRGKTSLYMADADNAQYVFYYNGYFYKVVYSADVFYAAGYNPATVEPTLKKFFRGFEIVINAH